MFDWIYEWFWPHEGSKSICNSIKYNVDTLLDNNNLLSDIQETKRNLKKAPKFQKISKSYTPQHPVLRELLEAKYTLKSHN
jgi:hypothetical protein